VAEVASAAKRSVRISHVVLTAGTAEPPGSEIDYMADCAAAVKQSCGLPIHVQFAPPEEMSRMVVLKDAGVDTVGIHVESFDPDILARMAPAKAQIGMTRYESAWKEAVSLFGANQVSSFLIVGLGERPETIVWGSEFLADLGVYPFVVPLRPIPGSRMQDGIPPDPETMKAIYSSVADILSQKGMSWVTCKAGCVRCGACSALPAYEKAPRRLICRSARNDNERKRAFAIRHDVFVKEQRLFEDSDMDDKDLKSIHLVAELDGRIVGTVRVFPAGSNGRWIGGRLAVEKRSRVYKVGAGLVKEAMKRVKKKNCTRFSAHIQQENVGFFKRLGWEPEGTIHNYFNRPHQLMVADLGRVPPDALTL
jgi:putative N-acetyltransferase (TIGR04045 family)